MNGPTTLSTAPTIADQPDTVGDRIYLVIGTCCWGRATNAKNALSLARRNYAASMFQKGYKPAYHLIEVPTGTYVTDDGGFRMPTKDCTYRWVGAFSGTGRRLPNSTDPFYSSSRSRSV